VAGSDLDGKNWSQHIWNRKSKWAELWI